MPRVETTVNGERRHAEVEARKTLADFLREDCGLTGTHLGCEQGECGSCSVLIDGRVECACLVLAAAAEGAAITTVEGLADGDELAPLQRAFLRYMGVQCGFCTPGMLVSATALLAGNPSPTEDEVRIGLSGNLCRCTGYDGIVKAVLSVSQAG